MATSPPRDLILTVYGAFARRLRTDGWLPVADLVRLLAELGVDEQAVRQAVSRLKRRGQLLSERRDGAVGYAPSTGLHAVLNEGDRRIFATRTPPGLAAGWTLAVFSVPETDRHLRHVLRARLSWLGFGNLAAGVWIAPHRRREEVEAVLGHAGLTAYVDLFEATHRGFGDVAGLVARSFDLGGLSASYGEFLAECEPVLKRWQSVDPGGHAAAAYVDYTSALTLWRRLPYLDPGLPAEVLPPHWTGRRAAELFHRLYERLDPSAFGHVRALSR